MCIRDRLDCCHAGALGVVDNDNGVATVEIQRGVTLFAAADFTQTAIENELGGKFTAMMIEGLEGKCADIAGRVTTTGLYNYIESMLQIGGQKPVFAANISSPCVLRKCQESVSLNVLKDSMSWFAEDDSQLQLDPTFESDRGEVFDEPAENFEGSPILKKIEPIPANVRKFEKLQSLVSIGLVQPHMDPKDPENKCHMFWAAVLSRRCELTRLGRYYWHLVKHNRL